MFPNLLPGTYLLFDNDAIADTYRLRRILHSPQREPLEPILLPRQQWEGDGPAPLHVLFDEEREVFRMWYGVQDPQKGAIQKARTGYHLGSPQRQYVCYAESRDGINWQRPDLKIYKDDEAGNNICFKGFSQAAGNILHRPDAPAAQRFLMPCNDWRDVGVGGIYIARSEDGLHWEYSPQEPLIFGHSDTRNCLAYNAELGVFMLYLRAWHGAAVGWPQIEKHNPRRRIAYSESKDLKTWSEPQIILTPDELDTIDLYGLQVFRWHNYFLGQLWFYDDDEKETIEVELVWSKDGFHWSRLPERPKSLSPGDGEYLMLSAQQPVAIGDEMLHYFAAQDSPHDTPTRTLRA